MGEIVISAFARKNKKMCRLEVVTVRVGVVETTHQKEVNVFQ